MTLKSLFDKRYTLYIKNLLKYSKLIVNDHFVLILFLLLGAGGFAYSEFLDTVTPGMVEPRLLVAILFFMLTSTGNLSLLLEPADRMYLLPKEHEFKPIFKKMIARSFLEQTLSTAALTFVTFPIFVTTRNASTQDSLYIFAALMGLKWVNLLVKINPYFNNDKESNQKLKWSMHAFKLFGILSLLFLSIPLTTVLITAIALISAYAFFTEEIFFEKVFKWETMIEAEENRMQRIYRFIQMFVNVPHMQPKIHRLPWLDGALNTFTKRYEKAPYYFILRTVARNPEYSMLILRVSVIGMILLSVTESFLISSLLMVLFLYVIGFQMISLIDEINQTPQFQMYPITEKIKIDSVLRIIFEILLITAIFLTLGALYTHGLMGFVLFPIGILFAYLFSRFYVPQRLKTQKR